MSQPEPEKTVRISLSEEKVRDIVAEATKRYATRDELDDAITAVRRDIRDSEIRLRGEWTDTVRYEIGGVTAHLGEQDDVLRGQNDSIRGIYLTAISSLVLLLCAILGLVGYLIFR